MLILLFLSAILLPAYFFLIKFYERAWTSMPVAQPPVVAEPMLTVTVIIPARNESNNIVQCLRSVTSQRYPSYLVEVIVVNDFSTDETATLVQNFPATNVRLINLKEVIYDEAINSYKKKAIEVAIAASKGELIITTDADCLAGPDWIRSMVSFQQAHQAVFIAAPVRIDMLGSVLGVFQSTDFLTLQGITAAAVFKRIHSMCNGANLAYLRTAFYKVGGFAGIDRIASGDDMLLMHKIAQEYPDRYFFLKSTEAIVSTRPVTTWRAFFQQRIRWASKAGHYNDYRISAVLLLVYLVNVLLLIILLAGLVNPWCFVLFVFAVLVKGAIEYPFVKKTAKFLGQQALTKYFFGLQPLHILYTVSAGFLGLFGSYEWKKRTVK